MAEAVVSFVVERVGDLLIEEAKLLRGVHEQVELMQTKLKRMQRFLKDVDKRQDENEIVKGWISEIREAAYDAEDVIETFTHEVVSRKGGGFRDKCKRYACIIDEGAKLHQIGSEIKAITTRITDLTANLQTYNIKARDDGESSGSVFKRQQQLRRSYSHRVEEHTVGLDENMKNLVAKLVNQNLFDVVSICGMGGLGKTTLANKFYHHDEVRGHFDGFAWACITEQFQPRDVWEQILLKLISSPNERREVISKMRDEEIAKELYQTLLDKTCLVILDDIWSVDAWDALQPAFPNQYTQSQSKIVLTTRNKVVALHVNPREILEPKCLTEEESWQLLRKKAFPRKYFPDFKINREMDDLGRKMVRRCAGLPLAINVLGGLLATKDSVHEWRKMHDNIDFHLKRGKRQEQDISGVHGVLALSYHELPYQLKPCFLYLSHFPEDYEISTKSLLRLWVAEGFVQQLQNEAPEGRQTMEDLAECYLHELINRCMVQVGEIGSSGRIKTCRVHDLMRDLCLLKTNQENFFEIVRAQNGRTQEASPRVHRLAVYVDEYSYPMYYAKAPNLRSLIFFTKYKAEITLKKSVISMFSRFELLKILTFDQRLLGSEKLMKDIGYMKHLRYLVIEDSYSMSLPSSIGNLRYLQTLVIKSSSGTISLPNVLWKLERLRHLVLLCSITTTSGELLQLGNLTNLQTLQGFNTKVFDVKELVKLTNLKKLGIQCEGSKDLRGILQPSGLNSFNNIKSFSIDASSKFEETDLKNLFSCCHQLYKLHLKGRITALPEHLHFPPNLTKLTLESSCLKKDPMATLEKLPKLASLYFKNGPIQVKEIVCSSNGFPQLKTLIIEEPFSFNHLEEWRVDKEAMSNLCDLLIVGCFKMKKVPDGLRFIATLHELEIKSMSPEFTNRLLEANGGEDLYKVQHVPSIIVHSYNSIM